jgi:hypothetical protein
MPPAKPKVPDDVRKSVDAQAAVAVGVLKKQLRKKPTSPQFNWPEEIFFRWHRSALYVVVVMRTPPGRPPTFESHSARMEYVGDNKFNLAVPMRRGWNTFMREASSSECFKEISELVCF